MSRGALLAVSVIGCHCCAGCMPPAQSLPAPPPLSAAGDWRVIAVNGRPSDGGATIRPPVYLINFGCNQGRAQVRIERQSLIVVPPFGYTERGCVNPDGTSTEAALREDEGFRIAANSMRIDFSGPHRIRISNRWGTIDLVRR
jgi:hypothetical protein